MMKVKRRQFMSTIAAGLVFAVAGTSAFAADWKPTRDIEFVVPNSAGGGNDLLARSLAKILTEEKLVPTSIAIVNKPGGAQAVGMGYAATNKHGDPHTLALISTGSQVTPLSVKNAKGVRDLQPIAILTVDDFLLVTSPKSKYKTAAEMVEAAKARPRSVSIGIGGATDEMAVAALELETGAKFNIVRFDSTGDSVNAVLGGHVDATTGNPVELLSQVEGGNLKGVAVFRPTRFSVLPDVATLTEQGIKAPVYQAWRGVAVPKGIPADAQAYWQDVFRRVAETKAFQDLISANRSEAKLLTGDELNSYLDGQEELYKRLLAR
jgi:putative tricarboxylic transport membrane protein